MTTNTNKLENEFIEIMKENFKKDLEVYYDEEACLYHNYESLMQAGGWCLWWGCERNISTIGFFNLANALAELADGVDCAYYFTIRTRLIDECQNWLIGKSDKRITF